MAELYINRGYEIFPDWRGSLKGRIGHIWKSVSHIAVYLYRRDALAGILKEKLQGRLFGDSKVRLCIPAFDGTHSEVFVYKTPHHPDYKCDRYESMEKIGLATSAAPTYFRPFDNNEYKLVDGGVWANNPLMLAVIEALICYDITPTQIDVLSIGCGKDPYIVGGLQAKLGGLWFWRDAIFAAMRLQSMAATNQARLLLGPPSVIRLLPTTPGAPIALDDWRRAKTLLPPAALADVEKHGDKIAAMFLSTPTAQFIPVPHPSDGS